MSNNDNNFLQLYAFQDKGERKILGYIEVDNPEKYICGSLVGYVSEKAPINKKSKIKDIFLSMIGAAKVFEILGEALKNTYQKWRHAEQYIAILEENMTDDEYEAALDIYEHISSQYARKPRKLPFADIVTASKLVLEAIHEEMGSDYIAELLNLDALDVEHALTSHVAKQKNVSA